VVEVDVRDQQQRRREGECDDRGRRGAEPPEGREREGAGRRFHERVAAGDARLAAAASAAEDCVADLDPTLPFSKVTKLRTVARNQIVTRCASVTPAQLGFPCDPGAVAIADTADCVLDAQILRVTQALAAEYGASCGVATAAGLATSYPALCTTVP
jgi:hypothetical protein